MLAAGGSAVDAVVATAFALAVREPWNSGLGGIGFMVVHPAGAGRAEVVDFGPIAPAALDPAAFPLTGETRTELFTWPRVEGDRNMHGPLSFAIPSAVRGYALAVERFGRMPWRDLVRAGGGAGPAGAAGRLVRDAEDAPAPPPICGATTRAGASGCPTACRRSARPTATASALAARPARRDAGAACRSRARRFLHAATSRRRSPPMPRPAGGALSADDLARCRARIVPSLDIPYRGSTLQAARGSDRRADPGRRARPARRAAASPQAPDAVYFEALIDALQQAYHARLDGLGDVEPAPPKPAPPTSPRSTATAASRR